MGALTKIDVVAALIFAWIFFFAGAIVGVLAGAVIAPPVCLHHDISAPVARKCEHWTRVDGYTTTRVCSEAIDFGESDE